MNLQLVRVPEFKDEVTDQVFFNYLVDKDRKIRIGNEMVYELIYSYADWDSPFESLTENDEQLTERIIGIFFQNSIKNYRVKYLPVCEVDEERVYQVEELDIINSGVDYNALVEVMNSEDHENAYLIYRDAMGKVATHMAEIAPLHSETFDFQCKMNNMYGRDSLL